MSSKARCLNLCLSNLLVNEQNKLHIAVLVQNCGNSSAMHWSYLITALSHGWVASPIIIHWLTSCSGPEKRVTRFVLDVSRACETINRLMMPNPPHPHSSNRIEKLCMENTEFKSRQLIRMAVNQSTYFIVNIPRSLSLMKLMKSQSK